MVSHFTLCVCDAAFQGQPVNVLDVMGVFDFWHHISESDTTNTFIH